MYYNPKNIFLCLCKLYHYNDKDSLEHQHTHCLMSPRLFHLDNDNQQLKADLSMEGVEFHRFSDILLPHLTILDYQDILISRKAYRFHISIDHLHKYYTESFKYLYILNFKFQY